MPLTRTMVIWLYNNALGYARLLVQNEVSQRTMKTHLNDQTWSLVTVCEVKISIDASIEILWTIFWKDVRFPQINVVLNVCCLSC